MSGTDRTSHRIHQLYAQRRIRTINAVLNAARALREQEQEQPALSVEEAAYQRFRVLQGVPRDKIIERLSSPERLSRLANRANHPTDVQSLSGVLLMLSPYDQDSLRLYTKIDLTEWVDVPIGQVLYVSIHAETRPLEPLGAATIWVDASTQLQHTRTKSAKIYLQGQIADQIRLEDFDGDIRDIIHTVIDSDAESAFSTIVRSC